MEGKAGAKGVAATTGAVNPAACGNLEPTGAGVLQVRQNESIPAVARRQAIAPERQGSARDLPCRLILNGNP